MQQSHTLPAAILAAGAMIGAGLYFGLRDRPPAALPATSPRAPDALPSRAPELPQATQAPAAPYPPLVVVEPGLPPVAAPSDLQTKTAKLVEAEIEKQRARIIKECWSPSVKNDPSPPKATIPARFLFSPDGKLSGYDVAAPEAASRADVSACIRGLKLSMSIPPPGVLVAVQVGIKLP
ncbi:MAG TPA: hypothetical protein VE093_44670 [Polyangiaceae bacterium]|jgi:hypothetical protein|nr:hypothetical protein [Polyangiaceae bacterium]